MQNRRFPSSLACLAIGRLDAPNHVCYDDDLGDGFGFIYRQPGNELEALAVVSVLRVNDGRLLCSHGGCTGLIERFNAAWELGDLATVSALLADDVMYCPNAWDGPASAVRGRDEVSKVLAEQLGPGEGPVLGPVWAAGDRVVCEWRWPPADDGTVLRGLDVYRVRDGRIAAKDVYGKITAGPDEVTTGPLPR